MTLRTIYFDAKTVMITLALSSGFYAIWVGIGLVITDPPARLIGTVTHISPTYHQKVSNTTSQRLRFTEKDIKCLARNIYYEARGEGLRGQIAVANVTVNRAKSDFYPDSICAVVHQPHQFSWTTGYRRPHESEIDVKSWRKALEIAELTLSGKIRDVTNGATHYHKSTVRPSWSGSRNIKKITRIGKHVFYKKIGV